MSILLKDNFTGTTIDTGKWTETDPNSYISQNDALLIANPHSVTIAWFTNKVESVASISSGVAVVQAYSTWPSGGVQESFGGLFLSKDSNNFALIGSRSSGGTYRVVIYTGGIQRYSYESSVTVGKDVKIWTDGTSIKFFYWSGSAWTQIGTDQTYSLGYNLKVVLTSYDYTSTSNTNPITIDNLYFSNADYTTQYPVSANTSNFFQLF